MKDENVYNGLSKPITEHEIREIEQKIGIDIPLQLVQHYLKYNGGVPERNFLLSEISGIETSVQVFLPMKYDNSVGGTFEDIYLSFTERNVFSKKYLPFAFDFGGNLFCINIETNQVVMIWMDVGEVDENKIPILCNCFDEFIDSLEYEDY